MRSIRLITDFPIKKYDKLISINNAFRSKINTVINSDSLKLSLESILSFFFSSEIYDIFYSSKQTGIKI